MRTLEPQRCAAVASPVSSEIQVRRRHGLTAETTRRRAGNRQRMADYIAKPIGGQAMFETIARGVRQGID